MARLDPFDQAIEVGITLGVSAAGCRAEPDAVAAGDDVALVGGQGAEQAADGAAVMSAIGGLDDGDEPVDAEYPAGQPESRVGRGHVPRRGASGFFLNDGPLARQVTLGADALI